MSSAQESLPLSGTAAPPSQAPSASQADAPHAERLSKRSLVWLSLPLIGQGFLMQWFGIYWMKFGTDVVGIAPAALGAILFASRLFDAVSDPAVGFWSDRTRHRLGRRRPWILASAIPLAIATVLLWAPPVGLSSFGATAWMGVAVIAFTASMTMLNVPHDALSAELTPNYHERNRLFGVRRAFVGIGTLAVFAILGPLMSSDDPRTMAATIAVPAAAIIALGAIASGCFLREPAAHRDRGAPSPVSAWRSVWRNENARVLLAVFFMQQIGIGCITVMAAYYTQYVMGNGQALVPTMGALFVAAILSIPLWVQLGRRFDKRSLVLVAMSAVGLALSSLAFIGPGGESALYAAATIGGVALGGLDVLFPSIQADVIDADELATGERKEGVYLSTWHFASKSANGLAGMLAGATLAWTGFSPNETQSPETVGAIRVVMAAVPLVTYGAGTLLFWRFGLDKAAHDQIRAGLRARANEER